MNDNISTENEREQHPLGKSIFLHFMPALIWLLFYIPFAWISQKNNIPTMFTMYILGACVLLPVQVGYLYYLGKKKNNKLSLKGIVLYRNKMPWWQYILFGVISGGWIIFTLFVFGSKLAEILRSSLFAWVPEWFYLSRGNVEQNGAFIETTMVVFGLVFIAIIGPLVEELYFRGFLLPRLSRYGKWAPLLNVTLFIAYHFWQPHFLLTGIVSIIPLMYFVWWKRNIYLGIGVHCFLNTLGWLVELIQRFNVS